MARKEAIITIDDEGRDKGKTFHIQEMPALQAEKWAVRALRLVAMSGIELPDVSAMGMHQIALVGIQALLRIPYEEAEPLYDELLQCIRIMPDPRNPKVIRILVQDDIEEVQTYMRLRMEALKLHVNFSTLASPSTSPPVSTSTAAVSPNIPTSPQRSAPSFRSQKTKQAR